jgi:hypothetical protein
VVEAALYRRASAPANGPDLIIQAARRKSGAGQGDKRLVDDWLVTVGPDGFQRMATAALAARKLIVPRPEAKHASAGALP